MSENQRAEKSEIKPRILHAARVAIAFACMKPDTSREQAQAERHKQGRSVPAPFTLRSIA